MNYAANQVKAPSGKAKDRPQTSRNGKNEPRIWKNVVYVMVTITVTEDIALFDYLSPVPLPGVIFLRTTNRMMRLAFDVFDDGTMGSNHRYPMPYGLVKNRLDNRTSSILRACARSSTATNISYDNEIFNVTRHSRTGGR